MRRLASLAAFLPLVAGIVWLSERSEKRAQADAIRAMVRPVMAQYEGCQAEIDAHVAECRRCKRGGGLKCAAALRILHRHYPESRFYT